MAQTKKTRGFARPVFLVGAVLAGLLVVGAVMLIINHIAFLSSSAYDSAEKYLKGLSKDKLYKTAESFVVSNITEYENIDDVKDELLTMFEKEEITIARDDEYSGASPVYKVYVGGREMFELSLKNRSLPFLTPSWKVKSFRLSENAALGKELIVEVPSGSILNVNGIELKRSEADSTEYYALTEFEVSIGDRIKSDRYSPGRFFLTPEVTAVFEGDRLRADRIEDGVLRYPYPSSYMSSLTLTVPFGSVIKLNGVEVDRSYRIETGLKYPFLTRFEEKMAGILTCDVYSVTGLFEEAQIEVVYNGMELTDMGENVYAVPSDQTRSITLLAPAYAVVRINGVVLSAADVSRSKVELPIMQGVSGSAKERPYLTEYKIEGLLLFPEISVSDEKGLPLKLSPYYSSEESLVYSCSESGSTTSAIDQTLRSFAQAYVNYIYSGSTNLSKNYNAVLAYALSNSLAYNTLKGVYNSLNNAPKYTGIAYGDMRVEAYYSYSTSAYSAIVTLPFTAVRDEETYTFEITLEILCNYSGTKKVLNYKVLNTVSTPPAE